MSRTDAVTADREVLRLQLVAGALPPRDELAPRVQRAVDLASQLGGPVAPALAAASEAADDARGLERARIAATAQARTIARVLAWLPLVAVPGLGSALDLPLLGFYATPAGRIVGVVGMALAFLGVAVSAAVTRHVLRPGPAAGADEVYDLVALALSCGLGAGAAVRAAAGHLPDHARDLRRLALELDLRGSVAEPPADQALAPLGGVLSVGAALGAPAAPSLRRLAADLRREERARVAAAAERLPTHLTFPTVLFLLPASLLLVGAPMLASGVAVVAGT